VRLGYTTGLGDSKAAGNYIASFRAQTSEVTAITGVRVYLYDSASATIRAQLSLPLVAGGADNRYDFPLTATGVFNVVYMEFYGASIPAGVIGYISEPMLEAGTLVRPSFGGNRRPRLRRNLALNPRAIGAGGTGWQSNSAPTNPLVRGVVPPVPHPLGIQTAAMQSSTGTNSALVTLYNIDSLLNTGTPARTVSVWMLITEPGYSSYGVTLEPNVWTFIRGAQIGVGGHAGFYANKNTGNASTTVRAYMTGALVEAGTTYSDEYFDGSITARAGYKNAWLGAENNSASAVYDDDLDVSWTGTVGASESILAGQRVAGVSYSGCVAIQSKRWRKDGTYSLRLIATSESSNTNFAIINASGSSPERGTVTMTRYQEAAITGSIWAAGIGRIYWNPTPQIFSNTAPNGPGETVLRAYAPPVPGLASTVILPHGGTAGQPDVWYDLAAIFPNEDYDGPAFTGDFPEVDGIAYRWDGTPGASNSLMYIPAGPQGITYYCDVNWHTSRNDECYERLRYALDEETTYEAENIPEDAPWYSHASGYSYPASPSRKFLGAYCLSASALSDSTREVTITEGILSGGVLGRERLAVPRFRFRVMLTAVDEEGLEYGKAWLSKALSEQSCSTHGPSCGSSDLTFFADCPPVPDFNGPNGAFDERIDLLSRMYHDVKCIEGPITTDTFHRAENSWGAIVEFTLAAGVPNMFGVAAEYQPIVQDGETIIQDVPINYLPYPSAELAGADITVATNYVVNPSVEAVGTGWAAGADGTNIIPGTFTSGRVTGELAAVGTASYRSVFTATGAGSAGQLYLQQEVDLSTRPANSKVSISMWAAGVIQAGTPTLGTIDFVAYWRATPGGAVVRTDPLGSVAANGGAISAKGLTPPVGATVVLVRAILNIPSWPAGTVVREYADALAVTVP